MAQYTTARTDAAVSTVVRRLRCPEGESLARHLLAAVAVDEIPPAATPRSTDRDRFDRFGLLPAALAALRVVRRRLGFDVPSLSAAAETLAIDPNAAAAAERSLVSLLSPPADEDERARLDREVRAAREAFDAAEFADSDAKWADRPDAGAGRRPTGTPDSAAERRAHLRRLEADRSMASLGFVLYELARGDGASDPVTRPRSDADRA
jgi:hypothetical protein